MSRERTLVLASPRIPNLNHLVLRARNEAQAVNGETPDAFDVTEEGMNGTAGGCVPEADGAVEGGGDEVGRRRGTVRIVREDGVGGGICGKRRATARRGDRGRVRVVVVGGLEISLVNLKVARQGEDLLDLADVAFIGADAGPGVEVPELNGHVVRGGEKRARRQIDLDTIDPLVVAEEHVLLAGSEVVHNNGVIGGRRGEQLVHHMKANDAAVGDMVVGSEGELALAGAPVPDAHGTIQTTSDEAGVVELQTANSPGVAVERPDLLAGSQVPYFYGGVVGSSDELLFVELQTHDAVGVSLEDLGGIAAVFPVCAHLEPVLVHVFPGPLLGLVKVRGLLIAGTFVAQSLGGDLGRHGAVGGRALGCDRFGGVGVLRDERDVGGVRRLGHGGDIG